MSDSLVKQKELSKLVNFLTELSNKSLPIINTKLIEQNEPTKISELLSNYMAYTGALYLMVAKSGLIWFSRKLLKSGKDILSVWKKYKQAVIDFYEAAASLVKPMEYFSKLYIVKTKTGAKDKPKPTYYKSKHNESPPKNVSSLSDILKVYTEFLAELKSKYVDTLEQDQKVFDQVKPSGVSNALVEGGMDPARHGQHVALGGDEVYIGGFQTQSALMKHLTKIELMLSEKDLSPIVFTVNAAQILGVAEDEVQDTIAKLNQDGISFNKLLSEMVIDKSISLIKWKELKNSIEEYFIKHKAKYQELIDQANTPHIMILGSSEDSLIESRLTDAIGWIERLSAMDKDILIGMGYHEFKLINNISTANEMQIFAKELISNVASIKKNPNKRQALLSELRFTIERLKQLIESITSFVPSIEHISLNGDGLELLKNYCNAEMKFSQDLNTVETVYNDIATEFGKTIDIWSDIISDDVKETCIKHTGTLIKSLLRANLMLSLFQSRFTDLTQLHKTVEAITVSDQYPNITLYKGGMTHEALKELAELLL